MKKKKPKTNLSFEEKKKRMTTLKDIANNARAPPQSEKAEKKKKSSTTSKRASAKTKFSKSDARMLTEKIVNPLLKDRKKVDPEVAEKARLVRMLTGYYERFEGITVGRTATQIKKLLDSGSVEELNEELKRCQSLIAAPFTKTVCSAVVFNMGKVVEGILADVLGDECMVGTMQELRVNGELDTEIEEISILWRDWLERGPYARILIKYMQALSHKQMMKSFSMKSGSTSNVTSSVQLEKKVVEEWENL